MILSLIIVKNEKNKFSSSGERPLTINYPINAKIKLLVTIQIREFLKEQLISQLTLWLWSSFRYVIQATLLSLIQLK